MIVSDERVARFVSESLDFGLCPPWTCMGIERDGKVIAGVLFNHFEGADVHVTAAGKGWTRAFLKAVGEYVFDQLECQRMTMVTESRSVAALGVRLGGRTEGVLRNHFGYKRDGLIIGVLREEYLWGNVLA